MPGRNSLRRVQFHSSPVSHKQSGLAGDDAISRRALGGHGATKAASEIASIEPIVLAYGCYRPGSLSRASAVSCLEQASDYPAERTISSSPAWPKMPGARGIVTAFARILVSEPCRPLDAIAMPALAADNPSPDLPAIHPVLTCHFRGKGPFYSKPVRCSPQIIAFRALGATFDPHGMQTDTDSSLRRRSRRSGVCVQRPWRRSKAQLLPVLGKTNETLETGGLPCSPVASF